MYIKYNNNIFLLGKFLGKQYIITDNLKKCDEKFQKQSDHYAKVFSECDPNNQDIFDVKFSVQYETGVKDVNNIFKLTPSSQSMSEGKLHLYYSHGFLPGWEIVEKYMCRKDIRPEHCEKFWIHYEYEMKDGKRLEENQIETKEISREEFLKSMEMYDRNLI